MSVNLAPSGRGTVGFVVADYSEEDENLRLRVPRSAKTSACTRGRSCLRGGCIGKRTEFPAAFCGSSGARSLRFSLRSGRTEQRIPPLPFLTTHRLPHKVSCCSPKQPNSRLQIIKSYLTFPLHTPLNAYAYSHPTSEIHRTPQSAVRTFS